MTTVNLDAEKFKTFMRVLSILKDLCNDCDIQGGLIRQRINSLLCLFEMDLTPIIGNINLPIIDIKKKLDILKIFKDNDIQISTTNDSHIVADESTQIKFSIPILEFVDNPFIKNEEFSSLFILDPEDLILDVQLNKTITKRIKVITENFDNPYIKIVFNNNTASIVSIHQSKNQEAVLLDLIPTNKELNGITHIITIPFIVDHDGDILLKIYETQEGCYSKFSAEVGGVQINSYTKSLLQEEDDEL